MWESAQRKVFTWWWFPNLHEEEVFKSYLAADPCWSGGLNSRAYQENWQWNIDRHLARQVAPEPFWGQTAYTGGWPAGVNGVWFATGWWIVVRGCNQTGSHPVYGAASVWRSVDVGPEKHGVYSVRSATDYLTQSESATMMWMCQVFLRMRFGRKFGD